MLPLGPDESNRPGWDVPPLTLTHDSNRGCGSDPKLDQECWSSKEPVPVRFGMARLIAWHRQPSLVGQCVIYGVVKS